MPALYFTLPISSLNNTILTGKLNYFQTPSMPTTKSKTELLLVRIQQGENKEETFEQLMINLHKAAAGESIGFEVISYNQHIYFFIRIPTYLHELIEGQLYAMYPDCEIEVKEDYTKFSKSLEGFASKSLSLTRSDLYPIRTFTEVEGDSLASIFSILSKAEENEQIWIQVLINPLRDNWKLNFRRRWKMKFINIPNFFRIKDYFKLKSRKEIRAKDRQVWEKKAEKRLFKTNIRLAYIAKTQAQAKQKLMALARGFSQFNTIEFNAFKESKIENSKAFLKKYKNLEFDRKTYNFSSEEVASVYHHPNADEIPHIVHVLSRKAEPPRDLPKEGTQQELSFFGVTNYHNQKMKFGIKRNDRRRHLYVVGKSGTGKSKLLELLIKDDILSGQGTGVLDPHGDLVDSILKVIPKERAQDVILFDPSDMEYPIAFNPLETVAPEFRVRITLGFIEIFKKLFGANWTPRLEHVLRYTTLALLDSENTTILSILKMLSDKNYRQKIVSRIQDSVVKNFWVNEFASWSEKFDNEAITPLLNKVGQFVSTSLIRNIVGQPKNAINIREIMDGRKILLMKISKGYLGEENAQLIGAMIITKIQQAAMARSDTAEEERRDFYLYCDEFQYFATDTFAEILSEARKYHLNITMAHQYMGQMTEIVRTTVFGNVGAMINFRVGAEDAAIMEQEYTPIFKVRDIINLGVQEIYMKMSVDGEMREAFSARTLKMEYPKENFAKEIIDQSREKYTRTREDVENDLKAWDEAGSAKEDINPKDAGEENFEEPLI